MNRVVPARITVVFCCLVVATCMTWSLGSGHALTGQALRFAVGATILIAFTKIYFIGQDFMELRHAPVVLRVAFAAWVVAIGAGAAGLYLV